MRFLKAATLMAVLLTCAVLMLGVLSLRSHMARGGAGGAAQTAALNGDLNCDGKRNISNAIALLQYLFQQGPEPCAIAAEQDLETRVTALETAAKKQVSVSTGTYIGDGKKSQLITTGLTGKLRKVEINTYDNGSTTSYDNFDPSGRKLITFSGPDFTTNEHLGPGDTIPGYPYNMLNDKCYWIAYSTPE